MKRKLIIICLMTGMGWMSGISGYGQEVLSTEEINELVPAYFKGFQKGKESVAKLITLGEIQYSMCEKTFTKGEQDIKILLFDFRRAPVMYNQAMRKWNQATPIVTDSLVQSPVLMENCSGWESYSRNSHTSQIFLGICDRYFLSLAGDHVDLKTLQEILSQFKLENFPR